jgi:mono/diheme cytochrome c family protein
MESSRTAFAIACGTILMLAIGPGVSALGGHVNGPDRTSFRQQEPDGKAMFEDECASCHGKQGRGNGRAGRDMDPRPTDITDPAWFAETPREEMLDIILNGKGEMDPYDDIYTAEEIDAILAYVEKLMERRKK